MILPMVLETGWLEILFGALSALAALGFLWLLVSKRHPTRHLAFAGAVLIFGVHGGWSLWDALAWRTVIDDAGLRVRSASIEGAREDTLPWSDVRKIEIRRIGSRARTTELVLAGARGPAVVIVLDALPARDVVPVVQLALARSKGAEIARPPEELLALARQSEENMLLTRYRVAGQANR